MPKIKEEKGEEEEEEKTGEGEKKRGSSRYNNERERGILSCESPKQRVSMEVLDAFAAFLIMT